MRNDAVCGPATTAAQDREAQEGGWRMQIWDQQQVAGMERRRQRWRVPRPVLTAVAAVVAVDAVVLVTELLL